MQPISAALATSVAVTAEMLPVHVGGGDRRVEGQRGEDRRLRRGVEAVDVGRGIGLRVAEVGGLRQGLGEARTGLGHAGQDVVGGAVHDADDATDLVAGERLRSGRSSGIAPATAAS